MSATWVTAAPLWSDVLRDGDDAARKRAMRRPVLLRFERDAFMADLAALLERDPSALRSHVAATPAGSAPIKLFAPAHGHFALVAATLSRRLPGLPEHAIDPAAGERVAFVVRRLDDAGGESARVDVPGETQRVWRAIASDDAGAIASGEELLALFGLRYERDGRPRRLYVGLVPTSAGDAYDPTGGSSYAIRCVYRRPLHADVVSDPTRPFRIAGFRDPEAPARPTAVPVAS